MLVRKYTKIRCRIATIAPAKINLMISAIIFFDMYLYRAFKIFCVKDRGHIYFKLKVSTKFDNVLSFLNFLHKNIFNFIKTTEPVTPNPAHKRRRKIGKKRKY